jgi:hypothetical protein
MKTLVLKIPDNKYQDFIIHVRTMFSDIQIKEKDQKTYDDISESGNTYETMLLSESGLAED